LLKGADFCRKNSRIASLMFCQGAGLRKTLKILVSTAKTSKCFGLAVESKLTALQRNVVYITAFSSDAQFLILCN